MYTDNRTVQILVAMLKKVGANRIVISLGTRNVPLSLLRWRTTTSLNAIQ